VKNYKNLSAKLIRLLVLSSALLAGPQIWTAAFDASMPPVEEPLPKEKPTQRERGVRRQHYPRPIHTVEIEEATYGYRPLFSLWRKKTVTDIKSHILKHDLEDPDTHKKFVRITLPANPNDLIGSDPAPGEKKQTVINLIVDGRKERLIIDQGTLLIWEADYAPQLERERTFPQFHDEVDE
jgi:hypothetical protein